MVKKAETVEEAPPTREQRLEEALVMAAKVLSGNRGYVCNFCGQPWPEFGASHGPRCPVGEALAAS